MTADIELLPLPPLHIVPSVEPVDYPEVAQALMDYARAVAEHNVAAKDAEIEVLRAELDRLRGEHVQNNQSVRGMLGQRGIRPESLPAEEDIRKLERRVKGEEKKLARQVPRLPGGGLDEPGKLEDPPEN